MRLGTMALAFGMASALMITGAAAQSETGLADIHQMSRVGGKVCFSDHFHNGDSSGQASRKAAERAAIVAWQDFTSLEYGSAWGSFANAESKGIKCSGSGSSWGCAVEARPCRRR